MVLTPVAFVLIGFVAILAALTSAYGVQCGFERIAARARDGRIA